MHFTLADQVFSKIKWADIVNQDGLAPLCTAIANTSYAIITLEKEDADLLRTTYEASGVFFAEDKLVKDQHTLLFAETPNSKGLTGYNQVNAAKELFRFRRHFGAYRHSCNDWWTTTSSTLPPVDPPSLVALKSLAYRSFDVLEDVVLKSMLTSQTRSDVQVLSS